MPRRCSSLRELRKGARHGVHTLGQLGPESQPDRTGLHELRRHLAGFNEWALDDEAAEPIFRQAVELGITFWDTANVYGFGTDYVDVYQIHRFDADTPVEETMEALDDVVKAGKARYIGASSMWAWQLSKLQHTADLHGWTRFVSMQNQYSLMQREEEREMFGLLADQGVGSISWSPLAKGRLARPWGTQTHRADTDPMGRRLFHEGDKPVADAVQQVAEAHGVPMAQIALAWVLRNLVVTAPIVGATKPRHLPDAVAALDVELTDDEVHALEEPYAVRLPTGY